MTPNESQRTELAAAATRGYLIRRNTSRRLCVLWSHYCDAVQSPMIEVILNGNRVEAPSWIVTYDLILTGASMTDCELRTFADLIDSVDCNSYVLRSVEGRTGWMSYADANLVAVGTVTNLGNVVQRCRAEWTAIRASS
jgi:hypothetical protein